jgi:hypothetical protein
MLLTDAVNVVRISANAGVNKITAPALVAGTDNKT